MEPRNNTRNGTYRILHPNKQESKGGCRVTPYRDQKANRNPSPEFLPRDRLIWADHHKLKTSFAGTRSTTRTARFIQ